MGRVTQPLLQIKCKIDCKLITVIFWMNEVEGKELGLTGTYFRQKCPENLMLRNYCLLCSKKKYICIPQFTCISHCSMPGFWVSFLYFALTQTVISTFGIPAPLLPCLQNGLWEFIILMDRGCHALSPPGCPVTHSWVQNKSPAVIRTKYF